MIRFGGCLWAYLILATSVLGQAKVNDWIGQADDSRWDNPNNWRNGVPVDGVAVIPTSADILIAPETLAGSLNLTIEMNPFGDGAPTLQLERGILEARRLIMSIEDNGFSKFRQVRGSTNILEDFVIGQNGLAEYELGFGELKVGNLFLGGGRQSSGSFKSVGGRISVLGDIFVGNEGEAFWSMQGGFLDNYGSMVVGAKQKGFTHVEFDDAAVTIGAELIIGAGGRPSVVDVLGKSIIHTESLFISPDSTLRMLDGQLTFAAESFERLHGIIDLHNGFIRVDGDARDLFNKAVLNGNILAFAGEVDIINIFATPDGATTVMYAFGSDIGCDLNFDGVYNSDDLDAMYAGGNVSEGYPSQPDYAVYDIAPFGEPDGVVDGDDLLEWLACAAAENGLAEPYQPGDLDLDGDVDFEDFVDFSTNFGLGGNWSDGNFDGDGNIDFDDFVNLSNNFGNTTLELELSAVPEPSMFPLLALAGLAVLTRHRRT